MELLLLANWLDTEFAGFDYAILNFYHRLAEVTGNHLTWFFKFISLLAESGYGMIALSAIMILVPLIPPLKKAYPEKCMAVFKCGCVAAVAIAIGFAITNLTIKESVARIRPYIDETGIYHQWWLYVESYMDPEYSFPSGHTTCTMATMTSIFLCGNRKKSWTAFILVILMGASRNYLMMHYPTDIIGGIIVGGLAAVVSYLFFKYLIFRKKNKKTAEV